MNTVVPVIFVLFLRALAAQDFVLDCEQHCPKCKDDVEEDCSGDYVLLVDGDVCKCCDQCGYKRGFQEECQDQVALLKLEDEVHAKVVPVQCQHGYECYSGVCLTSEAGFCSAVLSGRPYVYSCDVEGNFLPIQCSNYHCWCINPINGFRLSKAKVPSPMDSGNVSYCYYLMTVNGLLDILVPSPRLDLEELGNIKQRNDRKDLYQRHKGRPFQTVQLDLQYRTPPLGKNENNNVFYKLSRNGEPEFKEKKQGSVKEKTTRGIRPTLEYIMACNDGPSEWHLEAFAHLKNLSIGEAKRIVENFTNNSIDFLSMSNRTVKLINGSNVIESSPSVEGKWTNLLYEIINYLDKNMPANATNIYFGVQKIGIKVDGRDTGAEIEIKHSSYDNGTPNIHNGTLKSDNSSFDNETSEIDDCGCDSEINSATTLNVTNEYIMCQKCNLSDTSSEIIEPFEENVNLNETLQNDTNNAANDSSSDARNILQQLKRNRLLEKRSRKVNVTVPHKFIVENPERFPPRTKTPVNITKMKANAVGFNLEHNPLRTTAHQVMRRQIRRANWDNDPMESKHYVHKKDMTLQKDAPDAGLMYELEMTKETPDEDKSVLNNSMDTEEKSDD